MKDSPYDRPAVIETLASFVRNVSPAPENGSVGAGRLARTVESPVSNPARAAFEVICRRNTTKDDPKIDLRGCDLRGMYCEDANLAGVDFSNSHLGQSHFPRADMRNAHFMRTKLYDVWFTEADLSGSGFPEAEMAGCMFQNAVLDGANLCVARGITEDSLQIAKSYEGAEFPWM
ncbi:pentapeptide repeat-containing protein [Streptomyces globisporus]|uniref:pentapeptide repeat-containing protein n=1 Tax=Streptomyces globisporus TaxID=1908 RepID=UPI0034610830